MNRDLLKIIDRVALDDSGCLIWLGRVNHDGYGGVTLGSLTTGDKRDRLAHRAVYELLAGPVPKGMELDHLCRVRLCVLPDHLEPVTHRENMLRAPHIKAQVEQTECRRGHQYVEGSFYIRAPHKRVCLACAAIRREKRRLSRAMERAA